jgi:DNA excision repair protein ERCC-3
VPSSGPLLILSDHQILLEVDHQLYADARDLLLLCPELEKAPEHVYIYSLTRLSIWNARSPGLEVEPLPTDLARLPGFPSEILLKAPECANVRDRT